MSYDMFSNGYWRWSVMILWAKFWIYDTSTVLLFSMISGYENQEIP
jgi:hypothetical protein